MIEPKVDLRTVAEQAILAEFSPTSIVVNETGDILYIHGRTGRYLEPAPGEPSLNIVRMARSGLRTELTTALHRVSIERESIHYAGLRVLGEKQITVVNLTVSPITKPKDVQGLVLVTLEDVTPVLAALGLGDEPGNGAVRQRISDLEHELQVKDGYLQSTIEALETSNEELKSANEELQSANEELQSTNEELETSKEELQSINEELMTVNAELQGKMSALAQANNDVNNLMSGTGVGTIFVDHDLKIQRFTPLATDVINLISTDVGRPIQHIVTNLVNYERMVADIQSVLQSLRPKEVTVATEDGNWYLMRILPYRTLDNVIDGAVITFVDVSQQQKVQERLEQLSLELQDARDLAENVVETVRTPLLVLSGELRVLSTNPAFHEVFPAQGAEVQGRLLFDLGMGMWDIPELRQLLGDILPKQQIMHDFSVVLTPKDQGPRTILLNAREIHQKAGKERLILLGMEAV